MGLFERRAALGPSKATRGRGDVGLHIAVAGKQSRQDGPRKPSVDSGARKRRLAMPRRALGGTVANGCGDGGVEGAGSQADFAVFCPDPTALIAAGTSLTPFPCQ